METYLFLVIGLAIGALAAGIPCFSKSKYSSKTRTYILAAPAKGKIVHPKQAFLYHPNGKHTFVNERSQDVRILFTKGDPFGGEGDYTVPAGRELELTEVAEPPGNSKYWPFTATYLDGSTTVELDPGVRIRK